VLGGHLQRWLQIPELGGHLFDMAVFLFSVRLLVVLTIVFGGSSVVATERRQSFAGFGTSPHNYSGIPSGDYSTDWQNCTSSLFLLD
jgi:hypothetical protein